MRNQASARERLTIGLGIFFLIGVIALPAILELESSADQPVEGQPLPKLGLVTDFGSPGLSQPQLWGASALSLDLGSFDASFELLAGGQLVERTDGSALLTAVLAQRGYRARAFQLQLKAQRTNDSGGWRSYDLLEGQLHGLDQFEGAIVELSSSGSTLNVGVKSQNEAAPAGAVASFFMTIVRAPLRAEFDFAPQRSRAALQMDLTTNSLQFAYPATTLSDRPRHETFVADLGQLGDDFVFESGGVFSERSDGRAHFAGQLVRSSDRDCAYYLDLELGERRTTRPRTDDQLGNWTGLESWAFDNNGGPVTPATWRNYEHFEGRLVGLRACDGKDFELRDTGQAFQLGLGANGRNLREGGYGRFSLKPEGAATDESQGGFLSFDLRSASREGLEVVPGGFWIDQIGDDFGFASGGRLQQAADGSAHLTGIVARREFPTHRFFVDMQFSDRRDPMGVEPDRPTWTEFASVTGQLVGLDQLAGAKLLVSSTAGLAYLGLGAHGDPQQRGFQAPFDLHVVSQPRSDVHFRRDDSRAGLAMELTRTLEQRAEEALAATFVSLPGGHALYLPGVADDLVFPDGGHFQEFADGTATLEGHLVSLTNPRLGFDIQIDYSGHFDDAQLANLELSLPTTAYLERKGPVDTSLWSFYRRSTGILVGTDDLAGAVLEVGRRAAALQIGLGANGRNIEFGASGDLDVQLLSQAVGGQALLPVSYPGAELHIDLGSPSPQ